LTVQGTRRWAPTDAEGARQDGSGNVWLAVVTLEGATVFVDDGALDNLIEVVEEKSIKEPTFPASNTSSDHGHLLSSYFFVPLSQLGNWSR
jgi:hypothetical protein